MKNNSPGLMFYVGLFVVINYILQSFAPAPAGSSVFDLQEVCVIHCASESDEDLSICRDAVTDALFLCKQNGKRSYVTRLSDPKTGAPMTCSHYMDTYVKNSTVPMTVEAVFENSNDIFSASFAVYRIVETDVVIVWDIQAEIAFTEMFDPETMLPLTYPRFVELYGGAEIDPQS